jgi:hypothetical protein
VVTIPPYETAVLFNEAWVGSGYLQQWSVDPGTYTMRVHYSAVWVEDPKDVVGNPFWNFLAPRPPEGRPIDVVSNGVQVKVTPGRRSRPGGPPN